MLRPFLIEPERVSRLIEAAGGGTLGLFTAIRRLRAKVDDPYPLKLIHTVRGIGYRLQPSGVSS